MGCKDQPAGEGSSEGEPAKVRLALNWKPEPQFGGFYAAQEIGAFSRRGLEVEILPGGSGTPTVQMVAAGQAAFGIVSADELVIARSRDADVVALFAVYQTNPQGIMTHASRGFTAIGDVFTHDGTLAMQRGLAYAEFLVRKYGEGKVKIVPYAGGIASFLNDPNFSQQCFVTSEPLAARREGAEPKTFLIADAGYNPYTTVLVTRGKYLREHPQTVRAMIEAVREGWRSYLDEPATINQVMRELNPTMDEQTFADSAAAQRPLIETDETSRLGLGAMTLQRWQTLIEQLRELKVIDADVSPESCFADTERLTHHQETSDDEPDRNRLAGRP